jgi:hypothetical protein
VEDGLLFFAFFQVEMDEAALRQNLKDRQHGSGTERKHSKLSLFCLKPVEVSLVEYLQASRMST